jgi:hypothetical protein
MAAVTMKHKIITPEGNPAGHGNTPEEAIRSAADAYNTTTEAVEAALNSEGPDSLVHIEITADSYAKIQAGDPQAVVEVE